MFVQNLLYNSRGNGYLSTRLKYLRTQHRQSQNALEAAESEDSEETPTSCQEDVEYLKTAVVNDENMELIKSKLAVTSDYRRKIIDDDHSIDLLEKFPYFFTSPELVRHLVIP